MEHDWLKAETIARHKFQTAQDELQRDSADLRDAQDKLPQDDKRRR